MKIFRQIRERQLSGRHIGNYLLYAVGEILLVIIGILFALYINNNNQIQKDHRKIDTIFTEILRDLKTDIAAAEKSLEVQNKKDSLLLLLLNDKLTEEDFNNNPSFRLLLLNNRTMEFSSNGYKNLVLNIDKVPRKYDSLLTELNSLYSDAQLDAKEDGDKLHSFVEQMLEKWAATQSWFTDYVMNKPNPKYVEYFVNSPQFRNEATLYRIYMRDNLSRHIKIYQYKAILSYKAISNALHLQDSVHQSFIEKFIADVPQSVLNEYVGEYTFGVEGFRYRVFLENDQIHLMGQNFSKSIEFFPKSDLVFYNPYSITNLDLIFCRNADNTIKGLTYRMGPTTYDFTRVE